MTGKSENALWKCKETDLAHCQRTSLASVQERIHHKLLSVTSLSVHGSALLSLSNRFHIHIPFSFSQISI